jgi:hypothetical protein
VHPSHAAAGGSVTSASVGSQASTSGVLHATEAPRNALRAGGKRKALLEEAAVEVVFLGRGQVVQEAPTGGGQHGG